MSPVWSHSLEDRFCRDVAQLIILLSKIQDTSNGDNYLEKQFCIFFVD